MFARAAHRTQGNTYLLEDEIKDTDEQPDEEIHRVRSGRVREHRSFLPCGVGVGVRYPSSTWCGCVHHSGSSLNTMLWDTGVINS